MRTSRKDLLRRASQRELLRLQPGLFNGGIAPAWRHVSSLYPTPFSFFPQHVDLSSKSVLQHFDWGAMGKVEVRKGRRGLLGDGLFPQLSADGNPQGPLYRSASIKIQQGLASLAIAYRIIDDRRGFLDLYAGARYNYLGVASSADADPAGLQAVGDKVADQIASGIATSVKSAVSAEIQKREPGISEVSISDSLANPLIAARAAEVAAATEPARAQARAAVAQAKVENNSLAGDCAIPISVASGKALAALSTTALWIGLQTANSFSPLVMGSIACTLIGTICQTAERYLHWPVDGAEMAERGQQRMALS